MSKISLEQNLIFPTLEEIDLIRKKFNSIIDIPYLKDSKYINKNNPQNFYINKSLTKKNNNQEETIEKLNKKIEELQTTLNINSYKINNYDNIMSKNKELNNIIIKLKNKNNGSNMKINNSSNYEINEEENINNNYIKINENDINNISMKVKK